MARYSLKRNRNLISAVIELDEAELQGLARLVSHAYSDIVTENVGRQDRTSLAATERVARTVLTAATARRVTART